MKRDVIIVAMAVKAILSNHCRMVQANSHLSQRFLTEKRFQPSSKGLSPGRAFGPPSGDYPTVRTAFGADPQRARLQSFEAAAFKRATNLRTSTPTFWAVADIEEQLGRLAFV